MPSGILSRIANIETIYYLFNTGAWPSGDAGSFRSSPQIDADGGGLCAAGSDVNRSNVFLQCAGSTGKGRPAANSLAIWRHLAISEAIQQVIVHHPYRLHKGIADCRANEAEPALEQVFAHGARFVSFGFEVSYTVQGVLDRLAADKLPDVAIEAAELFLDLEECLGVGDGRGDLEPVAHNAGIVHEPLDLVRIEARDLRRIKAVECLAIRLALVEDRGPAQTGLGPFKNQELEEHSVVVLRNSPFFVVVGDHRGRRGPGTARLVGHGTPV
jgi:hypothetical protein